GAARQIARLAGERGWRRVLVVTSTYHIPRARLIFRRSLLCELELVPAGLRLLRSPPAARCRPDGHRRSQHRRVRNHQAVALSPEGAANEGPLRLRLSLPRGPRLEPSSIGRPAEAGRLRDATAS